MQPLVLSRSNAAKGREDKGEARKGPGKNVNIAYLYILSRRGTIAVCVDERPECTVPCAGARASRCIVSLSGWRRYFKL